MPTAQGSSPAVPGQGVWGDGTGTDVEAALRCLPSRYKELSQTCSGEKTSIAPIVVSVISAKKICRQCCKIVEICTERDIIGLAMDIGRYAKFHIGQCICIISLAG